MEEYKRKYSEVSERLMERNRQYQKLQGLYDSLRLRNMVVGVDERDAPSQPRYHNFNIGKNNNSLTAKLLSELHTSSESKGGCGYKW